MQAKNNCRFSYNFYRYMDVWILSFEFDSLEKLEFNLLRPNYRVKEKQIIQPPLALIHLQNRLSQKDNMSPDADAEYITPTPRPSLYDCSSFRLVFCKLCCMILLHISAKLLYSSRAKSNEVNEYGASKACISFPALGNPLVTGTTCIFLQVQC